MIATRWKTPLLLIGIVTSPLLLAGCSQTTSSHGMSVSGLT
ncbi:MAG: cell wall hydrolase, partial [Mesorhizobium sp.]